MPKHATVEIDDLERKMNEPVLPEEMELRRRVVAHFRAKMAKPATESDEKLWQEFLDLGKERLTFR